MILTHNKTKTAKMQMIEANFKLTDDLFDHVIGEDVPDGFSVNKNNKIVSMKIPVPYDESVFEKMIEFMNSLKIKSKNDKLEMFANKVVNMVENHISNHFEFSVFNKKCFVDYIIREYYDNAFKFDLNMALPALEPLSLLKVKPINTNAEANVYCYTLKMNKDTPLYKWLKDIFITESLVNNLYSCVHSFYDYELVHYATTIDTLCEGDFLNAKYNKLIVTESGKSEHLPSQYFIPAKYTCKIKDPLFYWRKFNNLHVELGVDHPKNKHSRVVYFVIHNYDQPSVSYIGK